MEAIEHFGIKLRNPNETVQNLSGGERQSIMIAKAVYFGAKLLVLDEPTIALSVAETRKVIDTVRKVKEEGTSVIFISHNIRHVCDIADRFTILVNGEKIGDIESKDATADVIEEAIVTGRLPNREPHRA
jgi:simple sugar transport system ATP-binding protein